jgi:hypothetical protein
MVEPHDRRHGGRIAAPHAHAKSARPQNYMKLETAEDANPFS